MKNLENETGIVRNKFRNFGYTLRSRVVLTFSRIPEYSVPFDHSYPGQLLQRNLSWLCYFGLREKIREWNRFEFKSVGVNRKKKKFLSRRLNFSKFQTATFGWMESVAPCFAVTTIKIICYKRDFTRNAHEAHPISLSICPSYLKSSDASSGYTLQLIHKTKTRTVSISNKREGLYYILISHLYSRYF